MGYIKMKAYQQAQKSPPYPLNMAVFKRDTAGLSLTRKFPYFT